MCQCTVTNNFYTVETFRVGLIATGGQVEGTPGFSKNTLIHKAFWGQ